MQYAQGSFFYNFQGEIKRIESGLHRMFVFCMNM